MEGGGIITGSGVRLAVALSSSLYGRWGKVEVPHLLVMDVPLPF